MSLKIRWKVPKPSDRPGFQLWRTHNLWQRRIKQVLLPFKLTHVQYILLEGISWINKQQEDIVTQAKLAETLEVDVMMTSVVIRSLLEKELIHREPHPRDTRAHQLVLTERGASLLKDAVRAVDSFENGFFETISTDIFQQKLSSILEGS